MSQSYYSVYRKARRVSYLTQQVTTGNLGKFYRYSNSKLSSKTNVGPLRQANGSLTVDPQVKAKLFSDHFGSAAFAFDNGLCPILSPRMHGAKLTSMSFTQSAVYRVLRRLKITSACGPDGISPSFLIVFVLSYQPLLLIFIGYFWHNNYDAMPSLKSLNLTIAVL